VRMTIELRDLSSEKLGRLAAEIQARGREIGQSTRTTVEFRQTANHEAAAATPAVQDLIEEAAADLKFTHRRLPSGAGHDAMVLAHHVPCAMLFVPSRGGISHSPEEFTPAEQCELGARVLAGAVRELVVSP